MTPDVNLLVAASRSDHPHHAASWAWLSQASSASAAGVTFTLMPMIVTNFLRIVTSPRTFESPASIDDALGFVDALLERPGVHMATLGPEWPTLRQLCLDKQLTGNDLPDAWLASATLEQSEHLVTFDSDFKKLLSRSHVTVLPVA
jgi:toxin-antitoxin system PIN domain toxin